VFRPGPSRLSLGFGNFADHPFPLREPVPESTARLGRKRLSLGRASAEAALGSFHFQGPVGCHAFFS
jgi:hypothetical protein